MTVKMTIALDDVLFAQVQSLTQELNLSPNRLLTMALQEFIKRRETQRMIAAINEAFDDFPDEEEAATLCAMKRYHQQLVVDDPW